MSTTNTAGTPAKQHAAGTLCSRPAYSVTVPYAPIDASTWPKLQALLIQQWPYWLTSDTTQTPPQAVSAFAKSIYEQYNGIQPDAGYAIDGENIRYWLAVTNLKASQSILHFSINAIAALARSDDPTKSIDNIVGSLASLKQHVRVRHPDYQARILILAAIEKGITWRPVPNMPRWWQFSNGRQTKYFFETMPGSEPTLGLAMIKDKVITSHTLREAGMPASKNHYISSASQAHVVAKNYCWPLVVKPVDRGRGTGVITDITNDQQLAEAVAHAALFSKKLLIEEQLPGQDYRLLVAHGHVLAATLRTPPSVTGDGHSSIAELVEQLNSLRMLDTLARRYLKQIDIDDPAIQSYLLQQEKNAASILAVGERVTLRGNANISTGGEPIDVTHHLHPEVAKLAVQATHQFGLSIAGVDYMTTDISKSWRESGGALLEINATPGLDLHVVSGVSETTLGWQILGFD